MTVHELENAIRQLPPEQLAELRRWFAEYDAKLWDSAIAEDVASGRLEALGQQALEEFREGRTRPL